MKKAALYDPYLDVLGGGEKFILSILKVLDDQRFDIEIFWDKDLTKEIRNRFNLSFRSLLFRPNLFKRDVSFIKKTSSLLQYDYFFYVTDGSYFFSPARRNFILCMVPDSRLYSMALLNRLKTANTSFISVSNFTKIHLQKCGVTSELLYPYIDSVFYEGGLSNKKEKIVLSVGRFFGGLHMKNHEVVISHFKKLSEAGTLQDYKLVLVGGLKKEDEVYFKNLAGLVKDRTDIVLKPNIAFKELSCLYKKTEFFWHFTGYGIDETKEPEKTEHLGITPLEAMASGCIVFCYRAGGPKELIEDGKTGFLFENQSELFKKMFSVINNKHAQEKIQKTARAFISENFSYDVFEKNVKKVLQI